MQICQSVEDGLRLIGDYLVCGTVGSEDLDHHGEFLADVGEDVRDFVEVLVESWMTMSPECRA